MKIIFTIYIKRKVRMQTAPFLFPHKYCATLSRSTLCYCPEFSLRNWMLLLLQGGGMHREFNFSTTKQGRGWGRQGNQFSCIQMAQWQSGLKKEFVFYTASHLGSHPAGHLDLSSNNYVQYYCCLGFTTMYLKARNGNGKVPLEKSVYEPFEYFSVMTVPSVSWL